MLSFKKFNFFNRKEILILGLLIISLLVGSGYNLYKNKWKRSDSPPQYESELEAFKQEIEKIIKKDQKEQEVRSEKNKKKRSKKKKQIVCVNINKATKVEFEQLPSIGPVLAQRIIDYREKIGQFKSLEELINIKGIGNKTFNKFKPYIKIVN